MSESAGGITSRKGLLIGAGIVALLAVVVAVVVVVAGGNSPRGWIADTFPRIAKGTYRSTQPPAATAARILARYRTSERVDSSGNVFLRYDDDLVGILPDGSGSQITVDDRERGYDRYRHHVSHVWVNSGGGSSFRGGGPGSGK
jgi:hypothetical protein